MKYGSILLCLLLSTTGCGEGACDRLETLKCDCHQILCDEAVELDTNQKDEEACEMAIQRWDCDQEIGNRDLDDHGQWQTSETE